MTSLSINGVQEMVSRFLFNRSDRYRQRETVIAHVREMFCYAMVTGKFSQAHDFFMQDAWIIAENEKTFVEGMDAIRLFWQRQDNVSRIRYELNPARLLHDENTSIETGDWILQNTIYGLPQTPLHGKYQIVWCLDHMDNYKIISYMRNWDAACILNDIKQG